MATVNLTISSFRTYYRYYFQHIIVAAVILGTFGFIPCDTCVSGWYLGIRVAGVSLRLGALGFIRFDTCAGTDRERIENYRTDREL